ncbi:hypothetical protein QBC40DRAFT_272561 [Triangularia verruculosa]|uniref:Uncharacterized protein n=1 Tax=Triangularia verruculosa TaxID=2587418 RepID=A0AAN6XPR4_9PEZI|nr:hypothetical protein QBC40DRAFT_272561 [Triangularia verruculosa]
MSNMARNRVVPALIFGGLFGGLLYSTAGGSNQPRPRARHDAAATNLDVSESLESFAGTGGKNARKQSDIPSDIDPKNTRIASHDPTAHAKRSPAKTLDLGDGSEPSNLPKNVGPH